jgi:hypothetical protein
MMEEYEKIKKIVQEMEADLQKFVEKHNNLAGTRVRKGLQDLKKAAQDMRVKIQDLKKGGDSAEA